jgi:hypothetical protein
MAGSCPGRARGRVQQGSLLEPLAARALIRRQGRERVPQRCSGRHAELGEGSVEVTTDRPRRQEQPFRDLLVRQARGRTRSAQRRPRHLRAPRRAAVGEPRERGASCVRTDQAARRRRRPGPAHPPGVRNQQPRGHDVHTSSREKSASARMGSRASLTPCRPSIARTSRRCAVATSPSACSRNADAATPVHGSAPWPVRPPDP